MYPAGFEPAMFAPTGQASQACGFDQTRHTDTQVSVIESEQGLLLFI